MGELAKTGLLGAGLSLFFPFVKRLLGVKLKEMVDAMAEDEIDWIDWIGLDCYGLLSDLMKKESQQAPSSSLFKSPT